MLFCDSKTPAIQFLQDDVTIKVVLNLCCNIVVCTAAASCYLILLTASNPIVPMSVCLHGGVSEEY